MFLTENTVENDGVGLEPVEFPNLTMNLVRDIYGVHKVFVFGSFGFRRYEPMEFSKDIQQNIGNQNIADFVATDSMIQRLSLYPTWLIRDDLFQVFAVQFAVSHLVNLLKPKQIGNGLSIHCIVIPQSVVSLYDHDVEFDRSIPDELKMEGEICIPLENGTVDVEDIVGRIQSGFLSFLDQTPSRVILVCDRRWNAQSLKITDSKEIHSVTKMLKEFRKNHLIEIQYEITVNQTGDGKSVTAHFHFGDNQCIRFWPEQLVWFIPRLFLRENGNDYDYLKWIYGSDYKHGFGVHLDDEVFSRFYKMLTGWNHESVNYRRIPLGANKRDRGKLKEISFRDFAEIRLSPNASSETFFHFVDENEYDSDAISDDVTDCNPTKIELADSNIASALSKTRNGDATLCKLMKLIPIYSVSESGKCPTDQCSFFNGLIRNLQKFQADDFKIKAENVDDFDRSEVIRQLDHLVIEHRLFSDENNEIIRQMIAKELDCNLGKTCSAFQLHCSRRREFDDLEEQRREEEDEDDNKNGDTLDLCEETKYSLCSAHCYLLHDAKFLYRLISDNSKFSGSFFSTEVVEEKKSDQQGGGTIISLDWGRHVLQWLPHEAPPCFKSFLEELSRNPESTVGPRAIKHLTDECRVLIDGTEYEMDEMMSLKAYSDLTKFQNKFRRAHWKRTPLEIRRNFFQWALSMYKTFLFHSKPIPKKRDFDSPIPIYHGLNRMFMVNTVSPAFQGPFSTTTSDQVVHSFASNEGGQGTGLEFTLQSSYHNPLRIVTGIDMVRISAFKHEQEILLYAQSTPITKTKAYENEEQKLVDHLMATVMERDTMITDKSSFYKRLGFRIKKKWIPIIAKHPLLWRESNCKKRIVARRLVEELNVSIGTISDIPLSFHISISLTPSECMKMVNGFEDRLCLFSVSSDCDSNEKNSIIFMMEYPVIAIPLTVLINNDGDEGVRNLDLFLGVSDDAEGFKHFCSISDIKMSPRQIERYDLRDALLSAFDISRKRYKFIKLEMTGWNNERIHLYSFSLIGFHLLPLMEDEDCIKCFLDLICDEKNEGKCKRWILSVAKVYSIDADKLRNSLPMILKLPVMQNGTTCLRCLITVFGMSELCGLFLKKVVLLDGLMITITKGTVLPKWVAEEAVPSCTFTVDINDKRMEKSFSFDQFRDFNIPITFCSFSQMIEVKLWAKSNNGDSARILIKTMTLPNLFPRHCAEQMEPLKVSRVWKVPTFDVNDRNTGFLDIYSNTDVVIDRNGGIMADGDGPKMTLKGAQSQMSMVGMTSILGFQEGIISLRSSAGFVNHGMVRISGCHSSKSQHGKEIIFISADTVFVNHGQIECGQNGRIIIQSHHFMNDGVITPEPLILIGGTEMDSASTLLHLQRIAFCGELLVFDGSNISIHDGIGNNNKSEISKFVFSVSIDHIGDGKEYTFEDIQHFKLPIISPVLNPNGHSVTLRIYAKPMNSSFDWMICKMIKWNQTFPRYKACEDMVIASNIVIENEGENKGNNITFETEGSFRNLGTLRCVTAHDSAIAVFAADEIKNNGCIQCMDCNDNGDSGSIVIYTNDGFVNNGSMESGRIFIECSTFVNSGQMSSEPFIVIGGTNAFVHASATLQHLQLIVFCKKHFAFDGSNVSFRGGVSGLLRSEISKFVFTVSIDHIRDGKEYTFKDIQNFKIPIISPVLNPNGQSVTLRIYAKPMDASFDWMIFKTINWNQTFRRYKLNRDILIGSDEVIESGNDVDGDYRNSNGLIRIETASIFSNKGIIRNVEPNDGDIVIFAVEGVCNYGHIKCGIIQIITDGGFVNNGVIECGLVIVECSEFVNEGLIAPRPIVVIGRMETDESFIQNMSSMNIEEPIKLTVRKHRGHYNIYHPQNLLKEGTGNRYSSFECGPPNEDWIVFEHDEESRFIPTTVVIRNYKYNKGIKRIAIYGGNNIDDLEKWIEIDGIHNEKNKERQIFLIGSRQRWIAYIEQFEYFKLRILENHGHEKCNIFYEFAILGVRL